MPVWSRDIHDHFLDAMLYGMAAGTVDPQGFTRIFREDLFFRPPQHGAIDFARGADGVWRIPQVWTEGDTIHFGVDLGRPGGEFTVRTTWTRR
jgi:hypothetical protein